MPETYVTQTTDTSSRQRLLVLTSTFPRFPDDHEPPFVFELARRLVDRFEVTVLAPHAPGAKHREVMDGVVVQRFRYAPEPLERLAYDGGIPSKLRNRPWLWLLVPVFLLTQWLTTWNLIRRTRPDVIHAHWLLPQGLIGLLARSMAGASCRLVTTAHGADIHGLGSGLAMRLKRWVIDKSDVITVVSADLAHRARALSTDHQKIHVLPMGVSLTKCFVPGPTRKRGKTLIFAGRLVEKKGVDTLLEAFAMLLREEPTGKLLIAGSGPLQESLEAQALDLGVSDQVDFLGSYRNQDLPTLFQQADIAVYPFTQAASGDQEGLGLVMVEAMGCGLPVVAGDLPAVHDVIKDKATGLLVPPQDPAALAQTIKCLLADDDLANELAAAGRRHALMHFDWQTIADRYSKLLAGPAAHR